MAEPTPNPLLANLRKGISKTVEVAFPTMGKFYHEGVVGPNVRYDSIEVHPMTINAEIILRDPILMASGRAIPKMIQALVPSILEPEELSDIDVEVILIAVRIASHGADLTIEHACENPKLNKDLSPPDQDLLPAGFDPEAKVCGRTNELRINLIDHIQRFDPITDWSPYRVDLPESNQVVHLQRMPYRGVLAGIRQSLANDQELEPFQGKTFDDVIMSEQTLAAYERISEIVSSSSLDQLLESIIAVENLTRDEHGNVTNSHMVYTNVNRNQVKEWLWAIPGDWVTMLTQRVHSFTQDLIDRNTITYKCQGCDHDNRFHMQLDVNKLFFSKSPPSKAPESASVSSTATSKSRSKRRSKIY